MNKILTCNDNSETIISENKGYYSLSNSNNDRVINNLRNCIVNEALGCILTQDSIGYPTFYSTNLTKMQLGGVFVYNRDAQQKLYLGKMGSQESFFDPKERKLTKES